MPRRVNQQALQDELWIAYYRSIDLILTNLIWFLFSVLIVTAVPALGGLFYATNQIAHGGSGNWRTFWEGFRRYFWLSWRWGLINAAVLALLGVSLWFYGQVETSWAIGVRVLLIGLSVVWIESQLFTFPLLLEQADQRFIVALRNSGVIFLRWPGTALGATLQIVIVALLSVLFFPPAWIFISASLCVYFANRAVVTSVQKTKKHDVSQDS
jgi:uncharacterized membrane protein YesL